MAMEFGALKSNFVDLNVLIERLESRMRYYEARAENISMAYLVWERFFFFAISQSSSSLKCTDWWVVLALSLSCAFLYILFFMRAVILLYWTQNQMDIICEQQNKIRQPILEAGDSSEGFEFNFEFHVRMLSYDSFKVVQRKVYICSIVFALLAVTAFESYSCMYLLCN